MKNCLLLRTSLLATFALALGGVVSPQAHSASTQAMAPASQYQDALKPGVVIEKVLDSTDAERAGLRNKDVILSWSRHQLSRSIDSQFDFFQFACEQGILGHASLSGTRDGAPHVWSLGAFSWLVEVRPNFSGWALQDYLESERLSRTNPTKSVRLLLRMAHKFSAGQPRVAAWIRLRAAQKLSSTSSWPKADWLYAQVVKDQKKYGPLVVTYAHLQRADLLWGHGDFAAARQEELKALIDSKTLVHDSLVPVYVLSRLLQLAWSQNDLAHAEEFGREAVATAERLAPGSFAVAFSKGNLAPVILARGDVARAAESYKSALAIVEGSEPMEAATFLSGLGTISWRRGDLDAAESYYKRSLQLLEGLSGGEFIVAQDSQGLGTMLRDRGELAKAEEFEQRALAMYRKLRSRNDMASSFNDLGFLALYRGNPSAAQHYFHEALIIDQRSYAGTLRLANTFMGMGMAFSAAGNPAAARSYLKRALSIQTKTKRPVVDAARTLNALGYDAEIRKDPSPAEEYYRAALAIEEQAAPDSMFMVQTLCRMGTMAVRRGSFKEAEQFYQRGLAIAQHLAPGSWQHAEILAALARLDWREDHVELAAQYYDRAITALEGQSHKLGGPSLDGATFRAQHEGIYREYVELLISRHRTEEAFRILESSRARALLETLAVAQVDVHRGADPDLLKRERDLHADINAKSEHRIQLLSDKHSDEQVKAVEKEISELTAQYQEVEAQLRSASPNYAALTQPQPLTAKEIQQQLLDQNTLLPEYSLGKERGHVFAVTPDSLQVFDLPARAKVERQARRVYALLTTHNHSVRGETLVQREKRWRRADAAYQREAAALSRMVLGPVAAQMGSKRLLIVADGALYYIPFAALPEPDEAEKASLPLAVNHEIVSLPSASVLALLRQQYKDRKPAPQAVAVLADPVFDRNDPRVSGGAKSSAQPAAVRGAKSQSGGADLFSGSLSVGLLTRSAADLGLKRNGQLMLTRLRYTREEADAIRAVTPPSQVLEAVDFRASRATATSPELANYRIVHFATHGLLNSKHPELSGLVLSLVDKRGKPQDGFLTLQDIYNMNLSADLVVLSACETGLGKEISGEGLIGMTRGFMYAGASRVVASLWNVSDVATARLMAEFYRGMEEDKLSPAAALRAAQVKMWKQQRWRSPYYWAAFQIQGEWR